MTNEELFFDALKSHRESKDIEISEICEFTKINPRYIESIESGEFNVLPTVYMRLFIRTYADFIGADSEKTLEDFELHTTGKVQKKPDFEIKPKEHSGKPDEVKVDLESTSQIAPKQIATGAAVIICLFLVLYWAGQITSEQSNTVEKASVPIEEKGSEVKPLQNTEPVPADNLSPSDSYVEKKSPIIDQSAVSGSEHLVHTLPADPVTDIFPNPLEETPDILLNKLPLNTNDFLIENIERQTTNIVKLFEPYNIIILTLYETKLNLSKSNEGKLTELINAVAPAGEIFQFDFESTINFEFWSSAHVRVKLNEIPLDTFLSNDGLSVRGSYEADKSQLYLGFYQN